MEMYGSIPQVNDLHEKPAPLRLKTALKSTKSLWSRLGGQGPVSPLFYGFN